MNSTPHRNSQNRLLGVLIYAGILLASLGSGAGLIYSLQPPKPPPPVLLYRIFLLDSETPIADFDAYVAGRAPGMQGITLTTSPSHPSGNRVPSPSVLRGRGLG